MKQIFSIALLSMVVTGCTADKQEIKPANPSSNDQTSAVQEPSNSSTQHASAAASDVQAKFTQEGDHPEQAVIQLMNDTKSTLDIAIYSLDYKPIIDAIVDAAGRGVSVRLITDQEHAAEKSKQKDAIQRMMTAGIPVKVNSHSGKMHLKMLVADGSSVEAGSFNYLKSSVEENDDVALIIHDAAVGRQFENAFNNMWNDKERFSDYSK
ncbi:phospholipase D-like domain-containing protein [Paenibacillus dendrobii]|nr:phospholipase D-like domain-containing protein [Paenibacillus dendrobii]